MDFVGDSASVSSFTSALAGKDSTTTVTAKVVNEMNKERFKNYVNSKVYLVVVGPFGLPSSVWTPSVVAAVASSE